MITHKTPEQGNGLVDQVAQTADNAIRSTQRLANDTLDSLAGSVQDVRHDAAPLLNRAGEQASALAQRGMTAVREVPQRLRDNAMQAKDGTVMYIKDEPLKSVLIAAAAGAALMALVGLLMNRRA
jgi:ElaB/YqjD/DUF883 family membrane-anchored ribosome-binding protein